MNRRQRYIRLAIALAFGGSAVFAPPIAGAQSFIDILKQSVEVLNQVSGSQVSTDTRKPAGQLAEGQGVAQIRAPMGTRTPTELRALLGRKVTGDELIVELKAIQKLMNLQRSTAALSMLSGSLDNQGGGLDTMGVLGSAFGIGKIDEQLREVTGGFSFQALDEFLRLLTEDPKTLKDVTLGMPSAARMTDAEVQRVVTMAALVVSAKASGRILEQAKKDLEGIEADFKQLIERREKAAALFYEVVGARQQAQRAGDTATLTSIDRDLGGAMSRQDVAFFETDLSRLSARQFANDMAAQNLALAYLRQRDPTAWQDYQAQKDGLMARTRAYVRAVGGIGAFGGLIASFINEVAKANKGASILQIIRLLPFGIEFAVEAPKLAKLAYDTSGGVALDAGKSFQRFSVTTANSSENFVNASGVVEALRKQQAEHLLAGSMFRDGSPGLIQRVHVCDASGAGRILDTVVPASDRMRFKDDYFGTSGPGGSFAFVNLMPVPADVADPRQRDLPDQLLKADLRDKRDLDTRLQAIGVVQKVAAGNASKLKNDQFMRLILANREGAAMHATLQLGEVSVRPIPSMESIFAYEALVDSCKSLVAPPAMVAAGPAELATQAPTMSAAPSKPPAAETPR